MSNPTTPVSEMTVEELVREVWEVLPKGRRLLFDKCRTKMAGDVTLVFYQETRSRPKKICIALGDAPFGPAWLYPTPSGTLEGPGAMWMLKEMWGDRKSVVLHNDLASDHTWQCAVSYWDQVWSVLAHGFGSTPEEAITRAYLEWRKQG